MSHPAGETVPLSSAGSPQASNYFSLPPHRYVYVDKSYEALAPSPNS